MQFEKIGHKMELVQVLVSHLAFVVAVMNFDCTVLCRDSDSGLSTVTKLQSAEC
jgi:hypothetical protein